MQESFEIGDHVTHSSEYSNTKLYLR